MEYKEYFGTKPRTDLSKQDIVCVFGNIQLKLTGTNYTNDENLWNYLPVLGAWPGRFISTSTGDYTFKEGDIDKMVASFDNVKLLPVDINHKREEAVGYVLDVKAFDGDLITYTSDGQQVLMDKPQGAGVLMMKIGLNDTGQYLLREGRDIYPSAVWTIDCNLETPTLCIDPADELMPALIMAATKGASKMTESKEEIKVKREALTKYLATKQEKKLVFKAIDSASPSYQPLMDMINKMTEEDATMLLDILNQQFTPETPPTEAKEELTAEKVLEIVNKAIDEKMKPQATDKPDEGELAARLAYIAEGLPSETVLKEAVMFKGVKSDEVKTTLKARFDRIKTFNGKSAVKEEVNPETLIAKGINPAEAFRQSREGKGV